MKRQRISSNRAASARIESLENRQLLSVSASTTSVPTLVALPPTPTPITGVTLTGRKISAEAHQPFQVVLGDISGLPAVPPGYHLRGTITWGDSPSAANAAVSPAQFVRLADGTIDVLGSHAYAAAGDDKITVRITEVPPAKSSLPVKSVGTFDTTAKVIAPDGGVTLEEIAGKQFTANLGTFRSNRSSLTMTATIDWGDGQTSTGKILALPVAGPSGSPIAGGAFAVQGTHTYAKTGSYAVKITVTVPAVPPPTATPGATPPLLVTIASIDTVIDVLPPPTPSAANT